MSFRAPFACLALLPACQLASGLTDFAPQQGTAAAGGSSATSGAGGTGGCKHKVFVTLLTAPGNVAAGLADLDAICQNSAMGSMLSGKWATVISVLGSPAASRIHVTGDVCLLDGNRVATATTWWSMAHERPINRAQNGQPVEDRVWTGTRATGEPSGANCNGWTSMGAPPPAGIGSIGHSNASNATWIEDTPILCGEMAHFYCISQ